MLVIVLLEVVWFVVVLVLIALVWPPVYRRESPRPSSVRGVQKAILPSTEPPGRNQRWGQAISSEPVS
jgi:hypothetical protein